MPLMLLPVPDTRVLLVACYPYLLCYAGMPLVVCVPYLIRGLPLAILSPVSDTGYAGTVCRWLFSPYLIRGYSADCYPYLISYSYNAAVCFIPVPDLFCMLSFVCWCAVKVVGVGGGGGNAVVRMTQQSIPGVEFWCLNTDAQVSCVALRPYP